MNPFADYHIPFIGLKEGMHEFQFELGKTFFAAFEHAEISDGTVWVRLMLEKQSTMMVLEFELDGEIETLCDRCGTPMSLDVSYDERLVVKYGDETGTTEDEILILGPSEYELKLEQYLYEFAHLALPARRVHEEGACDEEALRQLEELKVPPSDDDDDDDVDPRWQALKNLK